jgi:RNA-directed DNA polymerase
LHHRKRRCDGGTDQLTNLELLHPTCHRQHHSRTHGSADRPEPTGSVLIEAVQPVPSN